MNDTPAELPLKRDCDLGRLPDAGERIVLAPKGDELAELARWAEVNSIEAFTATIDVKRKSLGNYHVHAQIEADLTQECVVTLEPVTAHISKTFSRELHLSRMPRHNPTLVEALALGAGDDETPEEIDNPHYDVAGPVLEEFSLAIDPYPRAVGAAFESAGDLPPEPDNPFAILKRLKTGL